ncbi:disease resistance protein [Tanacetum coccineum]
MKLERYKFLILIDDVNEKLDLKAIGIPTTHIGSSMVITTNQPHILCDPIGTRCIGVPKLDDEESRYLFHSIIRCPEFLEKASIKSLITKILRRCGNNPLFIKAAAKEFKSRKDKQSWEDGNLPDSLPDEELLSMYYISLYTEESMIFSRGLIQNLIADGGILKPQYTYHYGDDPDDLVLFNVQFLKVLDGLSQLGPITTLLMYRTSSEERVLPTESLLDGNYSTLAKELSRLLEAYEVSSYCTWECKFIAMRSDAFLEACLGNFGVDGGVVLSRNLSVAYASVIYRIDIDLECVVDRDGNVVAVSNVKIRLHTWQFCLLRILWEVAFTGTMIFYFVTCYILLANHGVRIEDLTRVLSHPQVTSGYGAGAAQSKVPAGRYVVPTGKDNIIVSAGRAKVIPYTLNLISKPSREFKDFKTYYIN